MTLPVSLPYGIRDIKLTPYTDAGATALENYSIDLPYAQTLKFVETEDFQELRGDDKVVTTHGGGPQGTWELGSGGISLEAVAAISGATLQTTGVTPNRVRTLRKSDTAVRPWFRVEGQSISDSGGDLHVVLYRCRMTGTLDGELTDATFYVTSCNGAFLGSNVPGEEGRLWDFIQNESVTPIVDPGSGTSI